MKCDAFEKTVFCNAESLTVKTVLSSCSFDIAVSRKEELSHLTKGYKQTSLFLLADMQNLLQSSFNVIQSDAVDFREAIRDESI